MARSPILPTDEYVEQAFFFRSLRLRIADQQPAQDALRQIKDELLSSTRLPIAVDFLLTELKHKGQIAPAMAVLPHYFTPFQTFVIARAEEENSKFTFSIALLILEREAEYRAGTPTAAGLFIYELEAMSRNQLGYARGLEAMLEDDFFDDLWREYIRVIWKQLGNRELSELVFARSEHLIAQRQRLDPSYAATFTPLFGLKEGKIAAANVGKDPAYFFAALQRQLGYPEVPRLPPVDAKTKSDDDFRRKITQLETRVAVLEAELLGKVDLSTFLAKPNDNDANP